MRITKHIPNTITSMNLLCGALGVIFTFQGALDIAFYLMIAAAVCDFFDGFAARMLNAYSAMGKELDSLADLISFGLLPSLMLHRRMIEGGMTGFVTYIPLIICVFSALRLAKFNVDDTQHAEFCGLPTPANALFCLSLASLIAMGEFSLAKEWILLISAVMAYLLISPIRMFALKFKGFGLRGNEIRYGFIIFSAIMIIAFTKYAIPAIIITYIVVSAIRWAINRNKK